MGIIMKHFTLISAGVLLLSLGGCKTVGPDFVAPETKAPSAFKHAPTPDQGVPSPQSGQLESWWTVYTDPALDSLEQKALANNPSLLAVEARVKEARARLGITKADTRLSASTNASSRLLGESSERTLPIPGKPMTYRDSGDTYRASFDASYEFDLWGRVRRSVESAKAQVEAGEADARGARLTLTADLAQTYFLLRGLQSEEAVVARTLASRREAIEVLQARTKAGYLTEMDVQRARTELATLEADAADLTRRREQTLNALAVLTGGDATEPKLASISAAIPRVPPRIPEGIPAQTLRRRPDLAAAEAQLHARMAEIGVAEAARYPSIRLTGGAGFESADLGRLLDRPSQFWQIGPSLSLPLFDGGRIKANVEAAQARAEAARADHRQRTLNALREVEDALVELRQQSEQGAALGRAQEAASTTLTLANTRFDKGLVTYLDVIDAQRSTLQLERTQAQLSLARMASSVRLIRALGGSW